MEFITILICLVVERWTSFGKHVRRFALLARYLTLFSRITLSGYIGLSVILLPLVIVVGVVYWLLLHVWFGLFAFIFSVAILLYCLGEFEINKDVEVTEMEYTAKHDQEIATLLIRANHNIFAILFWFIILGPVGPILYRLNDILSHQKNFAQLLPASKVLESYLDWIPVRLFAFSFSLMSHFISVLKSWLKGVLSGVQKNARLLAGCGFAALDRERHSKHTTAEGIQQHVTELIDRSLVLWLVAMALIILL